MGSSSLASDRSLADNSWSVSSVCASSMSPSPPISAGSSFSELDETIFTRCCLRQKYQPPIMRAMRRTLAIAIPAIAPPLRVGSLTLVAGAVEVSIGALEGSVAALDVAEKIFGSVVALAVAETISGCDVLCKVLIADEISAALEEIVMSKVP